MSLGPGAFQEGLVCVLTVWVGVCPGECTRTGSWALPLCAEGKRLRTPDQGRVRQAGRPRPSFLGCAALDSGAAAARGLAPLSLAKQGLGPREGRRADSATCEEARQEGDEGAAGRRGQVKRSRGRREERKRGHGLLKPGATLPGACPWGCG